MKKSWIIFLTILISFCLFPSQTPAAANTDSLGPQEIIVVHESFKTEKKFDVPESVLQASRKIKESDVSSVLVNKQNNSLDEYIKSHFIKNESGLLNVSKDYNILTNYVVDVISKLPKQKAENAVWKEEGDRVIEFKADKEGLSYDPVSIVKDIINAAEKNKPNVEVNTIALPASNTLSQTNSYGISKLIASGNSNFAGSSNSRVKNIEVGMSKYKGYLLAPDETFSFNKLLGPVDGEHGFAPELVIKSGGLVKEFGGGICQVSTTVFRTALNAGLPISERRNHSFAVSYYAPQGTDATIYPGVQDLKFVNDTGSYVLIWPEINGTTLTFNFYGSPDGREVEVADPVPYGWQPNGAFSTALARAVKYANGEEKENIFRSYYRPKQEFIQTTTEEEPVENDGEQEGQDDQQKDEERNSDSQDKIQNDQEEAGEATNS